jgi:hypothetical protein
MPRIPQQPDEAVPTAQPHKPDALKDQPYLLANTEESVNAFMLESMEVLLGIARDVSVPINVRTTAASSVIQYGTGLLAKRRPAAHESPPSDEGLPPEDPEEPLPLPQPPVEVEVQAEVTASPLPHDTWSPEDLLDIHGEDGNGHGEPPPTEPAERIRTAQTTEEKVLRALQRGPQSGRDLNRFTKGANFAPAEDLPHVLDVLVQRGAIRRHILPVGARYELTERSRPPDG